MSDDTCPTCGTRKFEHTVIEGLLILSQAIAERHDVVARVRGDLVVVFDAETDRILGSGRSLESALANAAGAAMALPGGRYRG